MSSAETEQQDWPWLDQIAIARVLVKTARGPVVPGNYFYAIKHQPDKDDGIETTTYIPQQQGRQQLLELAEEFSRKAEEKVDAREARRGRDNSISGEATFNRIDGEAYGLRAAAQLCREKADA